MAEINDSVAWKSPSNIAIVKYWGKKENQIPLNPSLSFTLNHCCTETRVDYKKGKGKIKFFYEGSEKPEFLPKIEKFFSAIDLPLLSQLDLTIHSKNNFPHSAGIASSASAMSALSLCVTEIEQKVLNSDFDFNKISSIRARLGSGSACRSIFPKAALWGEYKEGSNDFAIDWSAQLHQEFRDIQDYIFLVSQSEKAVSSSLGHTLMNNHPYKEARIEQAHKNMNQLTDSLESGDWNSFQQICEEEALSLHALMMSSRPGYILLEPESLRIIESIKNFRELSSTPICFTIDAGPNIHVLFPKKAVSQVEQWIQSEWKDYLDAHKIIKDQMGEGPERI